MAVPLGAALASGFLSAQASLQIRHMTKWREPAWRTTFYFSAFSSAAAAAALHCFGRLEAEKFLASPAALGMGLLAVILGLLRQVCFTAAFSTKRVLLAATLQYFSIVFSALLGWAMYDERLLPVEVAGIALITVSGAALTVLSRSRPRADLPAKP